MTFRPQIFRGLHGEGSMADRSPLYSCGNCAPVFTPGDNGAGARQYYLRQYARRRQRRRGGKQNECGRDADDIPPALLRH